jgi:intron-binding protein aquarius
MDMFGGGGGIIIIKFFFFILLLSNSTSSYYHYYYYYHYYSYRWRLLNYLFPYIVNKNCNKYIFLNTFQLINVPPFQGQGEICPTPHFYQNLGEAEYVVAVYQFMRLMGYPAKKISIITTYNGQKHLIRDIVDQRCRGPLFGRPAAITTVDKYQGQQNDYILLSMVRTESVGHIRDIRRLVVAMSRARLGLYVFCRQSIFENCHELSQTFNILKTKPSKLQLVVGESYGDSMKRKVDNKVKAENIHTVDDVTAMGVLVYQMAQMSQNKSI